MGRPVSTDALMSTLCNFNCCLQTRTLMCADTQALSVALLPSMVILAPLFVFSTLLSFPEERFHVYGDPSFEIQNRLS